MGLEKWWQNRRQLQKVFLIASVIFVLLVLFIILFWCTQATKVCTDPECLRTATHILDTIDPSVDPCDNFYNFACGGFLKNAFAFGQPTMLHYLKELMKNKLKEIVVETIDERNLSKTLIMQRQFYRACINDSAIEEDNDQTFLGLLDEFVGGWPVLRGEKWNDKDFDWSKSMVKARKLGLFHQFYFRVEFDSRDSSNSTMLSIQPPLEKHVSIFYWQSQYLHLIHEIALKWGAAHDVKALDELKRTMHFAGQLNEIVKKFYNKTPTSGNKSDTTRTIKLKDLDHKLFKLNWVELLNNITGIHLDKEHLVIFEAEDYFTDLYYVLLMKTPKRTQANYMSWAVISNNLNYLSKKVRDKYKRITRKSNDKIENSSRSGFCYKASRKLFENVAEGEYIRRYTTRIKREYIGDIITNIKQQLKMALQKNHWMDKITKYNAINRLENITEFVGGTDVVYDANKFERTLGYNYLMISSDKLINMKRVVDLHTIDQYYKKLLRKSDAAFLDIPQLDVNAWYNKSLKKLILPTPLLQGQIFNEKRPHYVNYGSLGSIIGNQLTHGLVEFYLTTNVTEVVWWTNKTRRNFQNVTKCLIDENSMYTEELSCLKKNGSEVEEYVADISGVNFAYAAYQNWAGKNSDEESLPGIKYTPNQIFWIMASSHLCFDPKLVKKSDTMRMHSMNLLPSFRVIGFLKNSPYFAWDFNCPVGSKMNPEKKCQILT